MSDDVKNDLRGMADTGKVRLTHDIIEKFNEPQAALMVTMSDMRTETNNLFGKVFDRLEEVGSDIVQIKAKQTETNGHVGEALSQLAEVSKMESKRELQEIGRVNFRKGLIYIPTAILTFLQNPPILLALGGVGAWLLHHFKFIP